MALVWAPQVPDILATIALRELEVVFTRTALDILFLQYIKGWTILFLSNLFISQNYVSYYPCHMYYNVFVLQKLALVTIKKNFFLIIFIYIYIYIYIDNSIITMRMSDLNTKKYQLNLTFKRKRYTIILSDQHVSNKFGIYQNRELV